MGKTGTTNWCQVKGAKGQIRLVSQKDSEAKRPGPNQRYKSDAALRKITKRTESEDGRRGGRGGRSGGRGRGRGRGRDAEQAAGDSKVRRHIPRPKVAIMGAKQKAKR